MPHTHKTSSAPHNVLFAMGRKGDPVVLYRAHNRVKPAFADRRGPTPDVYDVWKVVARDTRAGKVFILDLQKKIASRDSLIFQTFRGEADTLPANIFGFPLVELEDDRYGERRRVYAVDNPESAVEEYLSAVANAEYDSALDAQDAVRGAGIQLYGSPGINDTFIRETSRKLQEEAESHFLESMILGNLDRPDLLEGYVKKAARAGRIDLAIRAELAILEQDVNRYYPVRTAPVPDDAEIVVDGNKARCYFPDGEIETCVVDRWRNILVVPAKTARVVEYNNITAHYGDESWDTGSQVREEVEHVIRPEYHAPIPEQWIPVDFGSVVVRAARSKRGSLIAVDKNDTPVALWSERTKRWVRPRSDVEVDPRETTPLWDPTSDLFRYYRVERLMALRQNLVFKESQI